jgi:dihydroflavonol-4-reductase
MSRYLVTGATGFLGWHLSAQLVGEGHEVVALCRRDPGPRQALPAGAILRHGDVTDRQSVADAAAGCDAAFHCAGLVSRKVSDAEAMYRVHVEGTKHTLAALRSAGVRRVVYASTSGTIAVSADPDAVADEGAPPPTEIIARWPYYRSKLYAERVALEHNGDGLEVVVCNPSLLLGPGDSRGSSTEDVRLFLERKLPFTPAGGIAFVDARDAAAGMRLALERGEAGERYLLNGANMTLAAFFGRLERISGVKAPPLRMPRTGPTLAGVGAELLGRAAKALNMKAPVERVSAEMAQYYWYCDSRRAERELGFAPRDPSDTLNDTVQDLVDRGAVWPL